MMDTKNDGLTNIARGAGILFFGSLVLYLFGFVQKLLLSRYLGPSDFGLLSLGMMVVNITALLATLGTNNGIIKYIVEYNVANDMPRLKGTVYAATKLAFLFSSFSSIIFIIFAKFIAITFFHNEQFVPLLIIFSLSIPFFTITKLIGKSFIAFKKPEYSLTSSLIGREGLLILLIGIVILISGSVVHIAFAFLLSAIIGLAVNFFFLEKKVVPIFTSKEKPIMEYKKLLQFSLPLFLSAIFLDVMGWADTFLLGYFKDAAAVGIYNVALAISSSIIIFLASFSRIAFPILTELRTKMDPLEVGKIFTVITRWIFLLSCPFLILFLSFPKTIIGILFGNEYISAYPAAIMLILGSFISVVTGPTVEVLKSFDKVKFIFWVNISAAAINIIFNVILIPTYGLLGAASSTAFSVILKEAIIWIKVRQIVPFALPLSYYLKYLAGALLPLGGVWVFLSLVDVQLQLFSFSALCAVFLITYAFLVVLFGGIGKEDKDILLLIEKKFKLDLRLFKKVFAFLTRKKARI